MRLTRILMTIRGEIGAKGITSAQSQLMSDRIFINQWC